MSEKKYVFRNILVAAVTAVSLAACGSPAAPEGVREDWGRISLCVPDGMFLTGGTLTNPEDDGALWLQVEGEPQTFMTVIITDEDTARSDIAYTAGLEDGKNVSVKAGGTVWTGTGYTHGEDKGFVIAGTVDGIAYEVTGEGIGAKDEAVKTVLSSISKTG